MSVRVLVFVLMALLLSGASFGQTPQPLTDAQRTQYEQQLQDARASTLAQVQAIEALLAGAIASEQEALQRQIADVKREGEIQRLEILLAWAEAEGDAARIAEIQQALANWRTPPQTQPLPQRPKAATPTTPIEKPRENTQSSGR